MIKTITVDMVEESGVLDLVWDVFKEFEAPGYSDEGIREFQDFIAVNTMKDRLRSGKLLLWGYWEDNKLVGTIATRPLCHISLLFVDKEYHCRGIAKSLYRTVLDFYTENSSYNEITVNSSPYAVEIYHKLGFADMGAEQTVNGIRFTPMKNAFR